MILNKHIDETTKKANEQLFCLILLKRGKVRPTDNDIINFYCTCIRPVLEYRLLFFYHSIPAYLGDLEHIQKRALSIISPGVSHHRNLKLFNLSTLSGRCQDSGTVWRVI